MRTQDTKTSIAFRNRMNKFLRTLLFGAMVVGGARVDAQSMDYGALEALFGEPVTTSVTGSPQRASQVPGHMEIITAEEIRRSGARDIPGVLRHVAGVDVLQWGNDNSDVAVRGYNQANSPRLLVLIDGRQVYADFFGFTPWATLPVALEGIRQIEVLKGPNSALFGFNAVAGVINIITWHPLHDDVNMVSVRAGTQDLAEASLVATAKIGDSGGIRVFLGNGSNDDFSTPQRPADANSRRGNEHNVASLNAVFSPRKGMEGTLEATYTDTKYPEIVSTYTTGYAQYRTRSVQGSLSADTAAGLVQGKIYVNNVEVLNEVAANSGAAANVLDNQVVVVQVQDLFKVGTRNVLRASVEYRHNESNTVPVPTGKVFYEVVSFGGMWEWKIAPSLVLTNAGRVDYLSLGRNGVSPPGYLANEEWNKRSLTELSFNSGLVWDADSLGVFRATVARGVQLPNLVSFGALLIPTPFGYISGHPFIQPTTVMHYELGWERELQPVGAHLEVSAFYDITKAIIAPVGGNLQIPGLIGGATSYGDSESYGVEVSLKGTLPAGWRWGLSYTPQIIRDHFVPGVSVEAVLTDFEHTNPDHVVNGNLGWARDAWEIDGYVRYESAFQGFQGDGLMTGVLTPIPDYVTVDARIAYRLFEKGVLSVSGQNLLHDTQQQTSGPNVERRVFATFTLGF